MSTPSGTSGFTAPSWTGTSDNQDDLEADWDGWQKDQSPGRLRGLVDKLDPVINKAIQTYVGDRVGPTVRDRARLMAIDALEKYRPVKGGSIRAHVATALQSLKRVAPKVEQPAVHGQDKRQELYQLKSKIEEMHNDLGREPSDEEIQEYTRMPIKKITKLRNAMRRAVSQSEFEAMFEQGEGEAPDQIASRRTPYDDWMDAVYHDLGHLDKLIMQYRSGYRGTPVLSNYEIARRLRISPQTVSDRANTIQSKLDEFNG